LGNGHWAALAGFYSRVGSDTIDFRLRFSAESPSLLSVAHTVSAESRISTFGRPLKRWVLSLVLNDRRQLDDVTADDKLFQVLAAVTGNAQSLIVESRVSGTTSAEVDDECRRCRPGSPATMCEVIC